MIRAQIYITEAERNQLSIFSHNWGKSQSELIREAIDQFIANHLEHKKGKLAALQATRGIWKNRDDLPDFKALRKEFDDRSSWE